MNLENSISSQFGNLKEKFLNLSGISQDVYERVGLCENEYNLTGIKNRGIAIPYRNDTNSISSHRVWLAEPFLNDDGKKVKYLQPTNSTVRPFFDPNDYDKIFNSNETLLITEGEKKLLRFKSCPEFTLMPIVSFPGAHNWQIKESGGQIAEEWQKIPMNERVLLMIADTDFFTNEMVYLGYIRLIKQLILNGAMVKLIDLRDDKNSITEKIGLDDAIEKFGVDFVKSKIGKPIWCFRPLDFSQFDSDVLDSYAATLVIFSKAERAKALDKMKVANNKFIKATARIVLQESLASWSKYKPKAKPDVNTIFWNPQTDDIKKLVKDIGRKMANIPGLFRYESLTTFVTVSDNDASTLPNIQRLAAFLANHISYRRVIDGKEGEEQQGIEHIPEKHLLALVEGEDNIQYVPEVRFVTKTPQLIGNRIIGDSGYDEESKIYYTGEPIVDITGTNHLDTLLDSFPFETEVDRLNCLGLIISMFYLQGHVGDHPAIIIQGDEQNLGKTTLARCLALLLQDKEAQLLAWTNDEELKKTISAILTDNDVAIIDNVKAGRDTTVISSPALEGFLTAPNLTFRALGENRVFSRPNNAIFIFTLNKGSFSDDLVVRSVCLSMSSKNKKKMNIEFNPLEYVLKNRAKILGEVASLIKLSFAHNLDKSSCLEWGNFKFRSWASKINNVLLANGKNGFLINQSGLSRRVNPLYNAVENFIVRQTIGLGRKTTDPFIPSDILREINPSVFNGDHSFASQVSLLGKVLVNIRRVDYGEDSIVVTRMKNPSGGGKSYSYKFSVLEDE